MKNSWVISSLILGLVVSLSWSAHAADLVTEKQGAQPSTDLKIKQSNVPQFQLVQKKIVKGKVELVRVQNIPRLNLGEEAHLKAAQSQTPSLPAEKKFVEIKVSERPSPLEIPIAQLLTKPITPVQGPKEIVHLDPGAHAAEAPHLPPTPTPQLSAEPKPQLAKIEDMPPVQMKLLQALIFLEIKKDFNMALALFAELLDEAEIKTEATYQLALTSKALGLYSEYKFRMMQVLAEPPIS